MAVSASLNRHLSVFSDKLVVKTINYGFFNILIWRLNPLKVLIQIFLLCRLVQVFFGTFLCIELQLI